MYVLGLGPSARQKVKDDDIEQEEDEDIEDRVRDHYRDLEACRPEEPADPNFLWRRIHRPYWLSTGFRHSFLPAQQQPATTTDSADHNTNDTANGDGRVLSFRPLKDSDRQRIQELHEEWFPVTYHDDFYNELVQHRLANTGERLFTCCAVLQNGMSEQYCQRAGCQASESVDDDEEIIGCIVGAVVPRSRTNHETANLLLPDPHTHSKLFYIMTLGTVSKYRSYGIATALVENVMEMVQQDREIGALYLHVIPFNQAAIRLYERLGFYRVQEIENYYSIDRRHYNCFLYAKYFHGNRGHRSLLTLFAGVISSLWQQLRHPLTMLARLSQEHGRQLPFQL